MQVFKHYKSYRLNISFLRIYCVKPRASFSKLEPSSKSDERYFRLIYQPPGAKLIKAKFNILRRQDIINGFSVGGVDYIFKPFEHEELLARVHTHLKLRKILQENEGLLTELQNTQRLLKNSDSADIP